MANEKHARSSLQASIEVGAAFLAGGTQEIARLQTRVTYLEQLLARAYPFLTWPDTVRGVDPELDAEFDGTIRDVEVAIQHLPDDKEY